jgi:hypothetical protein
VFIEIKIIFTRYDFDQLFPVGGSLENVDFFESYSYQIF